MISLETARQRIWEAVTPLPPELAPLTTADRAYLRESVTSRVDLPGFDNSAMDGYALQAAEARAASPLAPLRLRVVGEVAAGQPAGTSVAPGTCVRVFTGSALPPGADAVVMQEDTRQVADGRVEILTEVKPWENVRFRGEDLRSGQALGTVGQRLSPADLALFSAVGVPTVSVGRRPRVGIVATGSELVEPGTPLQAGQIYEGNRTLLAGLLARDGAVTRCYPLVPDDLAQTVQVLATAFDECDLVVTSGGVSVGSYDFVKAAIEQLGGEQDFWRVAIKPGKPFVFGRCRGRWHLGVPGNPVSAFVTALLLVRPAVLRLQGAASAELPSLPGILTEPVSNRANRRHFVRVRREFDGRVGQTGPQASHRLGSLAGTNALLDVPPETVWPAGTAVQVLVWEG